MGSKRAKKDGRMEQLPLFSNIPFSASIPNRAASKQENDFMVAIRAGIQDFVNAGGDYSEPITFELDFRKIAKEKGLERWESLQRSYSRTLSKVKEMPLTQTVHYITEDGEEKEDTYWMISKFTQNKTKGTVTVWVAPAFQDYYVSEILKRPDIQIDPRFYSSCKSSYTYPFMNWLTARIAEMQRLGDTYPYHISISYDELRLRVPTPVKNNTQTLSRPHDYRRNAIDKAIIDINTNPFSQLSIDNPDDIVSAVDHRRIVEFMFIVSFRKRTELNNVSLLVNQQNPPSIIDDAGIPSWEYLSEKMAKLGFTKSSIPRWEGRRAKVWKALLMTWIQVSKLREQGEKEINRGGYLQTLLKANLPRATYKQLAIEVIMNAPEYRDEVVDATAGYRSIKAAQQIAEVLEKNKVLPKQTVENNDFLKEYQKQKGHLPGVLGKEKK